MKLSEKRFKLFQSSAIYAIDRLGLHGWSVDIAKKKMPGSHAQCACTHDARQCSLMINSEDDHSDESDVEDSAYHEVVELLLSKYEWLWKNRESFDESACFRRSVDGERHEIINMVVTLIKYVKMLESKKGKK